MAKEAKANNIMEERTDEEQKALANKKADAQADEDYQHSIDRFECSLNAPLKDDLLARLFVSSYICVLVIVAYFLGKLRYGIVFIIALIYGGSLVHFRSMNKVKHSMQALIYNQTRKEKVLNNWESTEWINYIISRFWHSLEPVISKEVLRQVNPILTEKCPPFLASLRLSNFTLGSNPPFCVGICFFDDSEQDTVTLEVEFGFVPLDMTKDAYVYMTKKKSFQWNSKIVLTARLGTKMAGVGANLPIMVKNLHFQGRMRANIFLHREKTLVKSIEVCFMQPPVINFDLVPLRTVDLMDVPGLSGWISAIIDSTLRRMLVNPNSLKIDLAKPEVVRSIPMGVIMLTVGTVHLKENESLQIEIDIDGKKMFHTARREGVNINFNEYFFVIVETGDYIINFKCISHGFGRESFFGEGHLSLKKSIELNNHLESVRLWRKGNVAGTINVHSVFFPITDSVFDGTIARMRVYGVEDMQGQDRKKIYNSFFTLLACPKVEIEKKEREHLNFVTGTVNATALLVGGAISTAGNVIGNLIPGTQAQETRLLPSSESTFFFYESKQVIETNSPFFNEEALFFMADVKNDYVYFRVREAKDNSENIIGKVDIPVRELKDGEEWYKLKDAQGGRVKIKTELMRVNTNPSSGIQDFTRAISIKLHKLDSIYKEGIFFCVIFNAGNYYYIDPFVVGDIPIFREFILPVRGDSFDIRVYRETQKENDFIGTGKIMIKDILETEADEDERTGTEKSTAGFNMVAGEDNKINETNADGKKSLNDKNDIGVGEGTNVSKARGQEKDSMRLREREAAGHKLKDDKSTDSTSTVPAQAYGPLSKDVHDKYRKRIPLCINGEENGLLNAQVELLPLVDYKGTNFKPDNFKVVQVKFNDFTGIEEEFFIEFMQNNEIVKRSNISKRHKINETFVILSGRSEIRAVFKRSKMGSNATLGDCLIPKRAMHEKVVLNHDKFTANMQIKIKGCSYIQHEIFKTGKVTLFVKQALKITEGTKPINAFMKFFSNGVRLYKTKTRKGIAPVFDEVFEFKANMKNDVLRVELFDYNQFEPNRLVAYREIPLYFLKKGLVDVELALFDAKTFQKGQGTLKLGFKYVREGDKHTGPKIR